MEHTAFVRLETASKKCLCSIAIIFCFSVGVFVWGGIEFGPKVYRQKLISDRHIQAGNEFRWEVEIRSMSQKHRNLLVEAEFKAKDVEFHFSEFSDALLPTNRTFILAENVFQIGVLVDAYGLAPEETSGPHARDVHWGHPILKHQPADLVVHCPHFETWCKPASLLNFETVKYAGYNIVATFESPQFGKSITEARFFMRYGDQVWASNIAK